MWCLIADIMGSPARDDWKPYPIGTTGIFGVVAYYVATVTDWGEIWTEDEP